MKSMEQVNSKQSRRVWPIAVILLGVLLVSVILVRSYNNRISKQMFNERSRSLNTTTSKCAECLDILMENSRQDLNSAEELLSSDSADHPEKYEKASMLLDVAQWLQSQLKIDVETEMPRTVILLDSNLKTYSGDGHKSRWEEIDFLKEDEAICVTRLNYQEEDENSLFVIKKLAQPIPAGKANLTHVVINIPVSTFEYLFRVEEYQNQNFNYLVGSDGERMCRYRREGQFIDTYNVLHVMEAGEYVDGNTVEEVRECLKDRDTRHNACLSFRYEGTEYYASTVSLRNTNWHLVMFVPTEIISDTADQFRDSTYRFFIGLGAILLLGMGFIIWLLVSSANQRKINRQQEVMNQQLAEAADRAEAASEAKTVFLSNMSHDIRTPINGIMGMLAIAQKETGVPDKVQECLTKIQGASQHLLSLINDVLDMSRIESGKTVILQDPIDVRTVAANCRSIIRGQLDDRDLDLIVEDGEISHPWLIGDELRIRQVLINILGNAVKFTPDGGKIWFRVSELASDEQTATIRFQIQDTGMGMTQEFLGKIWDAFSQADGGARSKYKGTGLGMAITKQFVDLMGGAISVESEINVGSTFTVDLTLPIDQTEHIVQPEVPNIESLEGIHVLLAEDNELNMEIATELLQDEGMIVTPAENGQIAVDQFRQNPPGSFDLVLMDIMMPVMDGLEATRAIRATEGRPDAQTIPIVAMSANAFEEDIRKSIDAGMNAHLSKPINIGEVLKTISNYTR